MSSKEDQEPLVSKEEKEITIPPELENMLLEYTINALLENPEDLVSHAAEYFTRLRDQQQKEENDVDEGSKEQIAQVLSYRNARRGTVMGERYNPEEDEDEDDIETIPKSDEQRERIKSQAKDIFLFRVLDEEDLSSVIDAMIPKTVKSGDVVIKQGDDGDFLYLIDEGNFEIFIKKGDEEMHVGTYENKGFFGELALLYNQPRAATIKASSDGYLWAVDRRTFNKLIVKRAFEKRKMYVKLLEGVSQLNPLTDYEKMQVADALSGKSYKEGDIIVNEGDEGDGMYFIVEGNVSVSQKKTTDEGTKDIEIAQLGKGEFFGELALVKHQPRAATIVALENTKAAFLDVKAFERLLGPCMDIMKRHTETYKSSIPKDTKSVSKDALMIER